MDGLEDLTHLVNKHDTDIAVIGERLKHTNSVLIEIKENHLAHLGKDLDDVVKKITSMDKKIAYYTGGIGVAVTIGNVLIQYFIK